MREIEIYQQYILENISAVLLLNSIYCGLWEGWHPVPQDSRISPLQEDAKPSPQVGDGFTLGLPGVPRQAAAKLLHLPLCSAVPPSH